jgi:uncharacterized membrane protein YvbJ
MFCEECGGKVSANAKFCSTCGVELGIFVDSEQIEQTSFLADEDQNFELSESEISDAKKTGFADSDFKRIFIAISATIVIILSLMIVVDLNTMEPGSVIEDNYSQEDEITNSGDQSSNDSDSYSSNDYFNLGSREAEAGVKNRSTSQVLIDSFGSNRAFCEGVAQIYAGSPADAMEAYISGCTDYLDNNPHYVP